MELKTFVIGVALLLLTASISSNFAHSAPILSGNILYVGGSESGNYSKIQDAIDNAIDGDTVYVYNGIYTECDMLVDKSLNLVGESKEGVIVDSTGGFCSFKFLDVSNTNISSFTMKNGLMGILVEYHDTDVEHINIINCIIHDTQYYGIYTGGSNAYMRNSVIKNCEVYNTMNSITLRNFWTNTISDCYIHDNDIGIYMLGNVSNNYIYHNSFVGNTQNAYPLNGGPGATWDNGYPSGGNYWDDYTGVDYYWGPNQDIPGSDGIGDTPHVLDVDEEDRYPLIPMVVVTIVSIEPAIKVVENGETFDLYVYIVPGEPIAGIGIDYIYFDPMFLQVDAVSLEGFFDSHNTMGSPGTIDNVNGVITFAYEFTTDGSTVDTANSFLKITFTANEVNLSNTFIVLDGVMIWDQNAIPVPVATHNGEVILFRPPPTIEIIGCGWVEPSSIPPYPPGTIIELLAIPCSGWSFSCWAGDINGIENPICITLSPDIQHIIVIFIDTTPPEITNVALITSDPMDTWPDFGWENFTCTVTDDGVGVDEVKIVVTIPYNITVEYPMINIIGTDTYYYNTTFTIEGCYYYHIWADDTNGNNATSASEQFELPPNWDVNMDGKIRLKDFVCVAGHYGEDGPYGWIREDVNNDGKIRLKDFVVIAGHYGEEWEHCS